MLKPTKAKAALFLVLVGVIVGPILLGGSGPAANVAILAAFWLDGLVQALGVTVSVNGGVDAFNLVPPNALGWTLIVLGSAVSLAVLYVMAACLVSLLRKNPVRPEGASG